MGRKLLACGLVTEIDGPALALYVQSWARWVEAEDSLRKYGTVIKAPSGFPVQSPYLGIANKAMSQMTRLLVELGMSPSSRTRVAVSKRRPAPTPYEYAPGEEEPPDPRLLFLSEKQGTR